MPAEHDGPRPLASSLDRIARSVKRVDLTGFAAVEAAWGAVRAAEASGAVPVRLARGELVVAVATGAHASRARHDAHAMLAQLAEHVAEAPASIRVVVRP